MEDLLMPLREETQMRFAEIGLSRKILFSHQSVPAAAVAAEIQNGAGSAFFGQRDGGFDEFLGFGTAEYLGKGICMDISQLPIIGYIEVTGIYASVTLHYKLDGTSAVHTAGFRPLTQKNSDPVVDVPDTDIMTVLQIFIPEVEDFDEKFTVIIHRQVVTLFAPNLIHRLQTGDKL
jgi:hypothetical protein